MIDTLTKPLSCQRDLFQLDETVTYLNGAYMSPQLKSVEAAGQHALSRKNRPNRIQPEDFFSQVSSVKEQFAKLINATDSQRVALISSVSYGIATVANNLPLRKGQKIILAKDQFPSNYYSWARLAKQQEASVQMVDVPSGPDKGLRWNEAILNAIDEDTAAVAISHVHWAEGVRFDLAAIRERTREVGAWLIVDGTQSVGALPFDVNTFQPDALICAGYKWLMAPYSTALAYYGPVMDGGTPIEENWINRKDSQDFRNLVNYQEDYQPLAGRYCVGEQSNFMLIPMLEAALQQLNAWQIDRIQAYCEHLNAPYLAKLDSLGFSILPVAQGASHLLGVRVPTGVSIGRVQSALQQANVLVSLRGDAIRIAPNVYNNKQDWEVLMKAVLSVI